MLSGDLKTVKRYLLKARTLDGSLALPIKGADVVLDVLTDCIDQAEHMESARVQPMVTQGDLANPKIVLFPIIPKPAPVVIPIRTPGGDDVA